MRIASPSGSVDGSGVRGSIMADHDIVNPFHLPVRCAARRATNGCIRTYGIFGPTENAIDWSSVTIIAIFAERSRWRSKARRPALPVHAPRSRASAAVARNEPGVACSICASQRRRRPGAARLIQDQDPGTAVPVTQVRRQGDLISAGKISVPSVFRKDQEAPTSLPRRWMWSPRPVGARRGPGRPSLTRTCCRRRRHGKRKLEADQTRVRGTRKIAFESRRHDGNLANLCEERAAVRRATRLEAAALASKLVPPGPDAQAGARPRPPRSTPGNERS